MTAAWPLPDKALAVFRTGDVAQALALADGVLAADPRSAEALLTRAMIRLANGGRQGCDPRPQGRRRSALRRVAARASARRAHGSGAAELPARGRDEARGARALAALARRSGARARRAHGQELLRQRPRHELRQELRRQHLLPADIRRHGTGYADADGRGRRDHAPQDAREPEAGRSEPPDAASPSAPTPTITSRISSRPARGPKRFSERTTSR